MVVKNKKLQGYRMNDYIANGYLGDVKSHLESGIRTGFGAIDDKLTLYPGMYVLGAVSSLGKTTLCFQLAANLAYLGKHVIFFTLEQSCRAFTDKLSQLMHASAGIQAQRTTTPLEDAEDFVQHIPAFTERLHVVPADSDTSVSYILDYISTWMEENGEKPIVFVDYLQLVDSDEKNSVRETTDSVVKALKRFQKNNELILFVISSLNRSAYMTLLSHESFKESGGIEYGADVVLGLQYRVLHEDIFDRSNSQNQKKELLRLAKSANPRRLEMVCLKNRDGDSAFACELAFYPEQSYFCSENSADLCLTEQPIERLLQTAIPGFEQPCDMFSLTDIEDMEPEFF